MKRCLIVTVALGLLVGTLPISKADAGTIDDVLARVEKLERENHEMRRENASIRRENSALRDRMRRLEAGKQTAGVVVLQSTAAPPIARSTVAGYAATAPAYKAPPLTIASRDWTGFYVGAQAGAGMGTAEPLLGATNLFSVPPSPPFFLPAASSNVNGIFAGAQLGANYQTGPLVLGIETELMGSNFAGTQVCFGSGTGCNSTIKSIGAVSARVGGAVDSALVYAKGGVAWANYGFDLTQFSTTPIPTNRVEVTPRGWIAGAGIEYAFSSNWSGRIEYDFLSFGTVPVFFFGAGNVFTGEMRNLSLHLMKVGVDYKLY